jgi:hypothetical protein
MSWKSFFGTAARDIEKVAIVAAPVAATAFGGAPAGSLVSAVIGEIQGMVTTGTMPNKALLTTSIGQIIEGVIGVLQATGKIPALDQIPKMTPLQDLTAQGAKPAPSFPSTKV